MKICEVANILNAKIVACEELNEEEVTAACGCDLMSDVLAFSKNDALLLTGLINLQALRTAEMMDMKAIVFVRGKKPSEEIISMAKEKKIVLLLTELPLYAACGLLYTKGLKSGIELT
jgi:predicted transcriptional regulator